ncbi:MAG: hypothetical protein RR952_06690 [Cetobacterium sp.]
MRLYQFEATKTVLELRRELQLLVERQHLEQALMTRLIKKFAQQKGIMSKGQKIIVILEEMS